MNDIIISNNDSTGAASPIPPATASVAPAPAPAADPTAAPIAASTGNKKGAIRGSSFTPVEDVAIAKAWIAASEDAIVGTEQKGNVFYRKIQDFFNTKFKPSNRELRSVESVKTRCKTIHKECMRFSGCYARVVRLHPTGVSHMDMLTMATALYNGVHLNHVQDDRGKPFKHMQAWRVLKQHQKFIVAIEGSPSAVTPDADTPSPSKSTSSGVDSQKDDANEESPVQTNSTDRPTRRKRAKEAFLKREETAKKLRIAAQSVAAQQERNKALRRHYEILLFTNAPTGCAQSDAVEYFNVMRARALADLRPGGPGDEESNKSGRDE